MKRIFANADLASHGVLLAVVFALGLAWLLYPHPKSAAKQTGLIEITYWHNTPVSDWMQAALDEFERRNPEYHIVTGSATARDTTGDPTRFLLSVAGGVPPDAIYYDRFAIVEWGSRGAFCDLTPYIEQDKTRPDGVHQENYYAPTWLEPIYKGKDYAIPNSGDSRALFYNADQLIRGGFVYRPDDPEVRAGKAKPGEARPPTTWEEICRKLIHATGTVAADGTVKLTGFVRRPAVNQSIPEDARPDLLACGPRASGAQAAGARAGDVVVLLAGTEVFRGRVLDVAGPDALRIDLGREQPPSMKAIPAAFRGQPCEVKVFDQDGYVPRLSRYDAATGRLTAVGFLPFFGNSWLYMFGWLNGAVFMKNDGTECDLDSPEVVEALQWLVDVYDTMGGMERANVFLTDTRTGAVLDPFVSGKVAMRIDGNGFLSTIIATRPELNFGVAEPPLPEARMKAGFQSLSWSGGFAYAIPATARHKDAAWKLIRWLSSPDAVKIMIEYEASFARGQGRTYYPPIHPHRQVLEWVRREFLGPASGVPPSMAKAYDTFVGLMPRSKYRPVTPVGQRLWSEHARASEKAVNHTDNPYEALNYGKRQVQIALDDVLHPPAGPVVPWHGVIAAYVAAIFAIAIGLVVTQERRRRLFGGRRRSWLEGFICASPWLTGFLVFGAGPIVFSMVISFCKYDILTPAQFIGAGNYVNLIGRHYDNVTKEMTANDPLFWKGLANTGFMILGVPLGIVAGLALALLLDTKVRGLHIYRTIYYLPAIVPAVASFLLWLWIFSPSTGLLNQALRVVGISDPPNWLQDPSWSKPALIIMGLWGVGGGMIIWLAGLKDIPESLYEAAAIDGANRLQRFRHVTLPLLSPYILFNMIMGLIHVFQIFESAFIMTDGGPADSTRFYAFKLFMEAFRYLNMGAASAMAWILFAVVLLITLFQLWLSKKWVHYGRD